LLQLLNLLRILQDERVEVSLAADLELSLRCLLVAFYACSCISISPCSHNFFPFPRSSFQFIFAILWGASVGGANVHEASLRLQISMNYPHNQYFSLQSFSPTHQARQTYVLDVRNFLRHFGGFEDFVFGKVEECIEVVDVEVEISLWDFSQQASLPYRAQPKR